MTSHPPDPAFHRNREALEASSATDQLDPGRLGASIHLVDQDQNSGLVRIHPNSTTCLVYASYVSKLFSQVLKFF